MKTFRVTLSLVVQASTEQEALSRFFEHAEGDTHEDDIRIEEGDFPLCAKCKS